MKTIFTWLVLVSSLYVTGQTNRYHLNFGSSGLYDFRKAGVRDYGNVQLTGGLLSPAFDSSLFWFAKIDHDQIDWVKAVDLGNSWIPMDFFPFDVLQCGNGILFVGRSNLSDRYTASILKLDANGNYQWGRRVTTEPDYFSQSIQEMNPVIVTNDGVLVSLAGENMLQFTKFDLNGNLLYSKQLTVQGTGTGNNPGRLLIPTNNGGYIAGFECDGYPALVYLDATLQIQWTQKVVTGNQATLNAIFQISDGTVFIGGKADSTAFLAALDSSGTLLHYQLLTNSGLSNPDQLFSLNDSLLLANGRTGCALINLANGMYSETLYPNSGMGLLRQNGTTFTYSGGNTLDYYLDFDPMNPDCLDHTAPTTHHLTSETATNEPITATIMDGGGIYFDHPIISDLTVSLTNACFLSVENESTEIPFTVYPNPVNSGAVLTVSAPGMQADRIILTDLHGKTVSTIPFSTQVQLPELTPGMYFLAPANQQGVLVPFQKLVIR